MTTGDFIAIAVILVMAILGAVGVFRRLIRILIGAVLGAGIACILLASAGLIVANAKPDWGWTCHLDDSRLFECLIGKAERVAGWLGVGENVRPTIPAEATDTRKENTQ